MIGDFIIKRELGAGGMGTVYLAHQATLDRDVAIKILLPSFAADKAFIESFIREARAAAAVNHPNIVQAYAVNSENGLFYFAMEYIDGKTLKQTLAEEGPRPVQQVLEIAEDTVAALGFAWNERKIVHRDIKPDNIMFASTGHAKLADLGLARKITETNPDGSSELFGTPQYIAPELLFGYQPDARSDIYSLGCTLYHLLSGQCPYEASTSEDTINMHLSTPPTPLSELAPAVPAGLATMIDLMMAKRPGQRYPNYDLIAADLKLVKAGKAPAHAPAPNAQTPIDITSADPFAIPEDSPGMLERTAAANAGGKNKLKFTTGSKTPAMTGSPDVSANAVPDVSANAVPDISANAVPDDSAIGNDAPDKDSPAPKSKKPLLIAAALIVIALAGGGGWFAMNRGSSPDVTPPGESGANDNAPLAAIKDMINNQAPEAQIIAELSRLAPSISPGQAGYDDFLKTAAPYVEKALVLAREANVNAETNRWQQLAQAAKAEADIIAAEETKKADEAKKAEEEAQRLTDAQTRQQEQLNRLNEQKAAIRDHMLQKTNAMDFGQAEILFAAMLASPDPEVKAWAERWTTVINGAEKYYKMIRDSKDKLAGVKILVLGEDKDHKWQIASVVFDKVNLKYSRTRYIDGKEQREDIKDSLDIKHLLFDQLDAISQKLASTEGLPLAEIRRLSAFFLLARGAYLAPIANFLQSLDVEKELQDEVALLNGQAYVQGQLDYIRTIKENKDEAGQSDYLRNLREKQVKELIAHLKKIDPVASEAVADQVLQILGGQ